MRVKGEGGKVEGEGGEVEGEGGKVEGEGGEVEGEGVCLTTLEILSSRPKTMFSSFPLNQSTA